MIACDAATAKAGKADGSSGSRAGDTVTPAFAVCVQVDAAALGGGFALEQCGARWRVGFIAVVHFDDFDVPIIAELACGLGDERGEHRDA